MHGLSHLSGIKLLGDVDPTLPLPPLKLELSRYSKSAAQTIINAGGEVKAVYHNNLSLRKEWYPEKFMDKEIKDAKPTRKNDICKFFFMSRFHFSLADALRLQVYYTNPAKYGYLAEEIKAPVRKMTPQEWSEVKSA